MTKKRSSSQHEEYELIPIKPLIDLKNEMRQLRKDLEKEDSTQQIILKLLNTNVVTQRHLVDTLHKLETLNLTLSKLHKLFEDTANENGESDELKAINELTNEIREFVSDNRNTKDNLEFVADELKRTRHFRSKLPKGLPVTYRRSK